jgi:alpha-N-acetylglucosaminidase
MIKFSFFFFTLAICFLAQALMGAQGAMGVIERFAGPNASVILEPLPGAGKDVFEAEVNEGTLIVRANSPVAQCRGFYHAVRQNGRGICSWSGRRFEPGPWLDAPLIKGASPFPLRYYLNVVTFGYTTAFWDWTRWEEEIDWMALHGINLPLALTAQEAIMARVYKRMGLTEEEIGRSFCGPAHLPWLRMGNISGIDTPLPKHWHQTQIALQHSILERMTSLGMHPICPGFSGVVSSDWVKHFPNEPILQLHWGNQNRFETYLLQPQSPLFAEMQRMFIEEWEREFGPCRYYLIDSFNEMPVPEDLDLATYGEAVYQSLQAAHPGAVWVMQGWMFGYQRHIWSSARLQELLSRVPNEQMLILDLAADYTHLLWRQEANAIFYKGFFGKPWVLSYIPNMGGKTGYTGVLSFYATHCANVLKMPKTLHPIGFGFAPEGLENNEVIYELLCDVAWSQEEISLEPWLMAYSQNRYGKAPAKLLDYWQALLSGPYGSFTDHPRFAWQGRNGRVKETICTQSILEALKALDACYEDLKECPLYLADLRELGAIWAGSIKPHPDFEFIDALLCGHPLHRLEPWLTRARSHGITSKEADYYERSARRIITTWGPGVEDYSARLWSGLIRDYYAPRYLLEKNGATSSQLETWENNWVEQSHNLSPERDAQSALEKLRTLLHTL